MELQERLEEMVDATFADLSSEFLLMPTGSAFIKYFNFRSAYETLKRHTNAFMEFSESKVYAAIIEDSRTFCVVRAMLGMTPPEWAELARGRSDVDIDQGAARVLDRQCREKTDFVREKEERFQARLARPQQNGARVPERPLSLARVEALVNVAVHYLSEGAPPEIDGIIHRLDKFDTKEGLASLCHAANEDVPYPVLLYERYLGRPFAAHRDAVSELVGEVMEKAIEDKLRSAGVSYRKTNRAERIPGFGQAPDFCIPDEEAPAVVIEAKITNDDGTARDKVARIKVLASQRDEHVASGRPTYEVVACIDGRGFRERREDMRQLLLRLNGKVFTTATIDRIISHTRIHEFVARPTR
ncbi:MAG: hypothetical protein HY896_09960 [Deltaproteobacteria bacterium]|nr:hypothetical protein [Deltaproteobacteria bacterium]